jgi:hypothetical protein
MEINMRAAREAVERVARHEVDDSGDGLKFVVIMKRAGQVQAAEGFVGLGASGGGETGMGQDYWVVLGLRYTRSVGQETTETLRTSETTGKSGLFQFPQRFSVLQWLIRVSPKQASSQYADIGDGLPPGGGGPDRGQACSDRRGSLFTGQAGRFPLLVMTLSSAFI